MQVQSTQKTDGIQRSFITGGKRKNKLGQNNRKKKDIQVGSKI